MRAQRCSVISTRLSALLSTDDETRRVLSSRADLGGNDHRQDRRGPPRGLTLRTLAPSKRGSVQSRENRNDSRESESLCPMIIDGDCETFDAHLSGRSPSIRSWQFLQTVPHLFSFLMPISSTNNHLLCLSSPKKIDFHVAQKKKKTGMILTKKKKRKNRSHLILMLFAELLLKWLNRENESNILYTFSCRKKIFLPLSLSLSREMIATKNPER